MVKDSGELLKKQGEYINRARKILVETESILNTLSYSTSISDWSGKYFKFWKLLRKAKSYLRRAKKYEKQYQKAVENN